MLDHPKSDEYEVSVFGPGFGEAILVHLGERRWLAVDSCVDATSGMSVPVSYLKDIGVDLSRDVELIVASHWHNDHVAGISDLFAACESARFAMPNVFRSRDLLQVILQNSASDPSPLGKTTTEMANVIRLLKVRDMVPVYAGPDTLLLGTPRAAGALVYSLSPHSRLFEAFLAEIGKLLGKSGQPQRRLSSITPNKISVALLIKLLGSNVILGADLEEATLGGWSDILKDSQSLEKPIHVIKLPHHGSENAHFEPLWSDYLVQNAIALLTPFNRGPKKLPTQTDIDRIERLTKRAFATASPDAVSTTRRSQTVQQQMQRLGINIKLSNPRQGHIRLRCKHNEVDWQIQKFGTAKDLRHLRAWSAGT